MGKRVILYIISGASFVIAVVALLLFGLKPGIDFTGGSLLEVAFTGSMPSVTTVQHDIAPANISPILIQTTGDNAMILRTRFISEEEHQHLLRLLRGETGKTTTSTASTSTPRVVERNFETIGGTVSQQLRERSIQASILIIIIIVAFIAYAFRGVSRPVASWKYGLTAVIAMIHDVLITAGVFAVLGRWRGIEVDVPFLVAMLTVFGYSVNDTIVVFDRIRENLIRRGTSNFTATVNAAINETMARSINSSVATLIVMTVLFLIGGESIRYFALALMVGIFLGTYSSVFVASSLLVSWEEWSRKRRAIK